MGKRIAFDCPLDPGLGVRGERDVHVAIDGPDGRRCRSDIVKGRDGTIQILLLFKAVRCE